MDRGRQPGARPALVDPGLPRAAQRSFYALLLLGEWPGLWTILGGALIIVAGVIVVLFGEHEQQIAAVPEGP